ncbi:MAG: SAM-dependent methyltransferase [Acidimicrobiales bacterium]|nr:SAM-dependent methyltransferase [Acidimicrobiales bacterium]
MTTTADHRRRDYRRSHTAEGYGRYYDQTILGGYYGAMLHRHEAPVLERWARATAPRRVLDFACGTGRITGLLVPLSPEVVGVDVSADMLARARAAVPGADFRCEDLTGPPPADEQVPCPGPFDLVTAFRFFQNAEPTLRHDALRAIRARIAPDGELILNVQSQAQSPAGRAYRLRARLKHRTLNQLSHAEVETLLAAHGFRIEETYWYGHVPRAGEAAGRALAHLDRPVRLAATALHLPPRHLAQMFLVRARLAVPAPSRTPYPGAL